MKILVLNNTILAAGDLTETESEIISADAIYPKHVVEGAAIIEVEALPDDYAPGRYTYDGGFVRVPDPVPVTPVPDSISPRQIRQALTRAGLRQQVEDAVAAGDQDLKDWWEFATEFQRANEHVAEMAADLGVSDAQLDDLWRLGGAL